MKSGDRIANVKKENGKREQGKREKRKARQGEDYTIVGTMERGSREKGNM